MSFIWPWVLLTLVLVPVCMLLYRRLEQQRRRAADRLGSFGIVRSGGVTPSGARRHIPAVLFLVGLAVLLLAAARPQMTLPVPQLEGVVMLTFDVSASMAADDVEPTRMDAAKVVAQDFVERRPRNVKIGVVAFGEGGLVVQPPTDDQEALAATISRLVPQSGTSLGQGILATLNAISGTPDTDQRENDNADAESTAAPAQRETFAHTVIVLLTDGENTAPPDPLEAAQTAIEQGVRVHTVGVGSSAGTTLEIDGFNVHTQLHEALLEEIALLTEGDYLSLETSDDVGTIYEDLGSQFVVRNQEMEITSVLGGVSMIALLIGGGLSLLWFGRMP